MLPSFIPMVICQNNMSICLFVISPLRPTIKQNIAPTDRTKEDSLFSDWDERVYDLHVGEEWTLSPWSFYFQPSLLFSTELI